MKNYLHLFFDLDHTLWDFERNAEETLHELFDVHRLGDLGVPDKASYVNAYREINAKMWQAYHRYEIDKHTLRSNRFTETLKLFGVTDERMPVGLWEDYLRICPLKKNLFPGTIEALDYLSAKYPLSVITNGFHETQSLKLKNSGLDKYFSQVVNSETVGFQKPDSKIFRVALDLAGVEAAHSIMIGDNLEADIAGAKAAGMDALWVNHGKLEEPQDIPQILELRQLLELF